MFLDVVLSILSGKKCEKGDYVVTSHCNGNAEHFRWEWVEVEGQEGVGLMKTKSEMLCLEPNEDILKQHTLQPCDPTNPRQHFKGINFLDKFQLYPVINQRGKPRCMTMLVSFALWHELKYFPAQRMAILLLVSLSLFR